MSSVREALLPCPFCGFDECRMTPPGTLAYWHVLCQNCDTCGPDRINPKAATEAWNTRAALAPDAADAPLVDNPSGEYCPDCRAVGMSHCSDPVNCGGMRPMRQPAAPAAAPASALVERLRAWRELAEYANGGWDMPAATAKALDRVTGNAADALERLARELDALRADKARLDWLELIIRDGSYQSIVHDIAAFCQVSYTSFGKGPAIRSAIDAAIDAAKATP